MFPSKTTNKKKYAFLFFHSNFNFEKKNNNLPIVKNHVTLIEINCLIVIKASLLITKGDAYDGMKGYLFYSEIIT